VTGWVSCLFVAWYFGVGRAHVKTRLASGQLQLIIIVYSYKSLKNYIKPFSMSNITAVQQVIDDFCLWLVSYKFNVIMWDPKGLIKKKKN